MTGASGNVAFNDRTIAPVVGEHNTVNITYQNGQQQTVEVFRLLGPIEATRTQPGHWKILHEDLQQISVDVIRVRVLIASKGDSKLILGDWLDCSNRIDDFIKLKGLPEGPTRRLFGMEMKDKKLLEQLGKCRSELDDIIGRGKVAGDPFLELERLSGNILKLLDKRLQTAIEELAQAISQAWQHLTEPPATS